VPGPVAGALPREGEPFRRFGVFSFVAVRSLATPRGSGSFVVPGGSRGSSRSGGRRGSSASVSCFRVRCTSRHLSFICRGRRRVPVEEPFGPFRSSQSRFVSSRSPRVPPRGPAVALVVVHPAATPGGGRRGPLILEHRSVFRLVSEAVSYFVRFSYLEESRFVLVPLPRIRTPISRFVSPAVGPRGAARRFSSPLPGGRIRSFRPFPAVFRASLLAR
jgi:hypothetical protein